MPVSLPRLRPPQGDGEILVHPPAADVGQILDRNRGRLNSTKLFFGRALAELRRQAIAETIAAARAYLSAAGEPVPDIAAGSLISAGHQPDLFHPGVWLKNFALASLARKHGAAALNLIVDNDTVKRTAIAVPTVADDPARVHRQIVSYDTVDGEVPFEDRPVRDGQLFDRFADRVGELTEGWPSQPFLPNFWGEVRRQRARTPLIGEMFAAARRNFERRWGCHNLEVPLSRLANTASFAEFALALLANLPQVNEAYNEAVRGYRKRHDIRSPRHPVPDLARDGDWLEAPFWAWRSDQPRRERLFITPCSFSRQPGSRGGSLAGTGEAWPQGAQPGADQYPLCPAFPGGPVHSRQWRWKIRRIDRRTDGPPIWLGPAGVSGGHRDTALAAARFSQRTRWPSARPTNFARSRLEPATARQRPGMANTPCGAGGPISHDTARSPSLVRIASRVEYRVATAGRRRAPPRGRAT